jgi:sugar phosphate isomerase/epimerase
MELGIFARTFQRTEFQEVFTAVASYNIHSIQFNFSITGLPTLPEKIDLSLCKQITEETVKHQLKIAAVSGTFNMINPDYSKRETGLKNLRELALACKLLNAPVITLCTGTCDPENMWRRHPGNDSSEAWRDLTKSMSRALELTEVNGITLAFEPELNNVVNSAEKACRLIKEMQSSRLKVVLDGANLVEREQIDGMKEILDHAIDLLGDKIILAHAKDISRNVNTGYEAAGHGLLDFDHYLKLLQKCGFNGALILHGIDEAQVGQSVDFIRKKLGAS